MSEFRKQLSDIAADDAAEKTGRRPLLKRRWARLLMAFVLLVLSVLTGTYQWVAMQGSQGLYREVAQVPYRQHAMLLGTAPTVFGRPNLYYTHRLEATVALWRAHKFAELILSGSRHMTPEGLYDEIGAMREDLLKQGLPPEILREDPEAHRTLLSIQRAASVFGLSDYLLITQAFHCERSLFIARDLGQQPICYAAEDVPAQPYMLGREMLSRLVAVIEAASSN